MGRFFRKFFLVIWTLVLTGILTGCLMGFFLYTYVTSSVLESDAVRIDLATMPVNLSSTLYCKNPDTGEWTEWYTLQNAENREWLDGGEIPDLFRKSFVAIEDERFYTHPGIDVKRTVAAGLNFLTGKHVFGGSTITQQLIKNLSGDNAVTINRKLREICRAIKLEQNYSKDEILEWYLNVIYFGYSQYGISAASQYYFGKDADELSLAEICCITGITNNPSLYNPYTYPEKNERRRHIILDKMLELEMISQSQHDEAYGAEISLIQHTSQQKSGAVVYPYYVDAVIDDVIEYFQEQAGVSREQATDMLYYGGYRIYTCVDLDIQAKIDAVYGDPENIPKTRDGKALQSAMTVVEPASGNIVGMAGGVGEKKISRGLNWACSRLARRPPGSSLKPVSTYGPAMDAGLITPNTYFMDSEETRLSGTDWMPFNDNRKYNGPVTVYSALVRSLNTVSAQILDRLGPEASYEFLTDKLGFELEPDDLAYAPLSVGQLTVGTTTREMASAYTIFPNMGVYREGRTFSIIKDHDGKTVYENDGRTDVVISDKTAYWMTRMLTDAVQYGTGGGAKLKNMPAAGKTGTTSDAKDRWFAGFTPYYVGVVWTGYEKPSAIHVSGNPAANIWKQVMTAIHGDLPVKDFTVPVDISFQESGHSSDGDGDSGHAQDGAGPGFDGTVPEGQAPNGFDESGNPVFVVIPPESSEDGEDYGGEDYGYDGEGSQDGYDYGQDGYDGEGYGPVIVVPFEPAFEPSVPDASDVHVSAGPGTPVVPEPQPVAPEPVVPEEVPPGTVINPWTLQPE